MADFIGAEGPSARRRAYLEVCVELLVDDLEGLAVAWGPGKGRYRARFLALDSSRALGHILTGLATLSGFELASERIAVPLDSRSQEDEHSCFSDTTHQDFAANAEGVARVYFGLDPDREGPLGRLVRAADPRLADELCGVLKETVRRAQAVPSPVDRALAAADGDPERVRLEELVAALQRQAKLLKAVGVALGIDVRVRAE